MPSCASVITMNQRKSNLSRQVLGIDEPLAIVPDRIITKPSHFCQIHGAYDVRILKKRLVSPFSPKMIVTCCRPNALEPANDAG